MFFQGWPKSRIKKGISRGGVHHCSLLSILETFYCLCLTSADSGLPSHCRPFSSFFGVLEEKLTLTIHCLLFLNILKPGGRPPHPCHLLLNHQQCHTTSITVSYFSQASFYLIIACFSHIIICYFCSSFSSDPIND